MARTLGALPCVNLAERLGVAPRILHELGENDRSATGFLEPDVFEATTDRFFAAPDRSIHGWETAAAAQARIVGGLLQCSLRGALHGWRRIDGDAP